MNISRLLVLMFALSLLDGTASAQSSSFTFQGRLNNNGAAADGSYEMQFKLYDAAALGGGTQIGTTITLSSVPVTKGIFTLQLDFGANAFPGADRFLETAVRSSGSAEAFTVLSPRQPITPTPYAIRSSSALSADSATNATNASNASNATNASHATTADNASNANNATTASHATNADSATNANNAATAANAMQLGGVAAGNYVQTNDGRLSDARAPLSGSANYIQNTTNTTVQQKGNFSISGDGILGGSLAVGTTNTPLSKLDVVGQDAVRLTGYQPFLTLYDSNAGYARDRIQGAGGDLNLFTENYLNGSDGSAFLKLANSGNVGIGTATPNTKLTITGGAAWTSAGWTGSMNLQNASALGWEANASGQRAGIGHSGGGTYFFRTNSAFGNTASPANYDLIITDTGNLTQPRDKGGLVKAMAFVNPFNQPAQYVVRSYNSQSSAITMTRGGEGSYVVNFGFDVRDRFVSVTTTFPYGIVSAGPFGDSDPNSVNVSAYNVTGGSNDMRFFIFVY